MKDQVVELSNFLEKRAFSEASCFPVDRFFLEPYIDQILKLDKKEFLLYNLERGSNTYTIQLFLCLPELWTDIFVDDIIDIIRHFTNIFSFYTLIEFTYKYIEIDIIGIIVKMETVSDEIKKNIVSYLNSSLYLNLLRNTDDELFFKEDLYGVQLDNWMYIRQRLLLDNRVAPTLKSLKELHEYTISLYSATFG